MTRPIRHGLMAGAAGTTALHGVTYLVMALRKRAVSPFPIRTVEAVADACGFRVPGTSASRAHRTYGIAALRGIGTGLTVGVAASAVRAAGARLPLAVGGPATGAAAMALGHASPIARGLTDPRDWTPTDWVSDALPHLAYGITTSAVLAETDRPRAARRILPSRRPGGLLLRSAALGFAAGARSTMGVAGVLLTSRWSCARPARGLRRGLLVAGSLAVAVELVADKLSVTPSRLQPPSLAVRVASGLGGGVAMARQVDAHSAMPALVGGVCAAGGSLAGAAWREAAATHMPHWASAVVEDAAALLLTAVATRPDDRFTFRVTHAPTTRSALPGPS
jgi:uncharacterized membrane protein